MTTIRIEVVSDLVCPWCFIGKRHLDTTLATWRKDYPQRPVAVTWRPFFLNADTPAEGEPYRPFLENKFGSAREVDALLSRVSAAGIPAGIRFAFDRIQRRPNTMAAHRLIHYAQKVGAGETAVDALVEALFVGGFEQGADLGDHTVLTRIAGSVGLDANEIQHYLASDTGHKEVAVLASEATRRGVSGVPCFIIESRFALSGAQPPEQLRAALDQAAGLGSN